MKPHSLIVLACFTGVKLFSASTDNLATTETLEHAYNRLNRRRRKLDILRREVHFDGHDVSDVFSLGSDVDAGPNEPDFLHSMTDISNGKKGKFFCTMVGLLCNRNHNHRISSVLIWLVESHRMNYISSNTKAN